MVTKNQDSQQLCIPDSVHFTIVKNIPLQFEKLYLLPVNNFPFEMIPFTICAIHLHKKFWHSQHVCLPLFSLSLIVIETSSVINIVQAPFNVDEIFYFSCLDWLSFITSSCPQNKKVGILFLWVYFMT